MARLAPSIDQIANIYIDETSQTKHRYLALGGIILDAARAEQISSFLQGARLPELPNGELDWTKVSRGKLPAYRRVVDTFFDAQPSNLLDFHMLVVDTSRVNDAIFNSGSRETGFNKEIYQLLRKFARLYKAKLFHAYLDKRTTNSSTEDLRAIVNRGVAKTGDGREWPFRRVHFRDSARCQILQVVDILLGAVAFHMNGHRDAEGASPAKCDLSDHILKKAHIRQPLRDTAVSGRFTIWHRKLR